MEKMEQKQAKLIYEAPSVEVLHWGYDVACDMLSASTDVGGEYDDENWQ